MGNWRKSTYSDANGGDCIEVASDALVMVRDTGNRDGAMLTVSAEAWQRFISSLSGGDFCIAIRSSCRDYYQRNAQLRRSYNPY
jgi:Domain of unknown function (DUF397)